MQIPATTKIPRATPVAIPTVVAAKKIKAKLYQQEISQRTPSQSKSIFLGLIVFLETSWYIASILLGFYQVLPIRVL